jgi:hypothetical protein
MDAVAHPDHRMRQAGAEALLGGLAILGLGVLALVRIALNLPMSLPVAGIYPYAIAGATLGPAIGLLALGVQSDSPTRRVGLTFAGVFGLLSLVAEPAALPATLALLAAIAGLAGERLYRFWAARRYDQTLVLGALALGGLVSLASGIGVEPATLRPLGSKLVLLGVAASPVFVDWNRESLLVGLGVGVAVLAVGVSAPFITGAVSLVVGGVVGASLALLFLAAVGAVSLLWASVRTGRRSVALAAGLLLVAGIPATIPRGLGFLAAIALLGGVDP